jgi:hypothetical protein
MKIYQKNTNSIITLCVGLFLFSFTVLLIHHQYFHTFPEKNARAVYLVIFICVLFGFIYTIENAIALYNSDIPIISTGSNELLIRESCLKNITIINYGDIDDIFIYGYSTKIGNQYKICISTKSSGVKRIHATYLTESPDKILTLIRESVWGCNIISEEKYEYKSVERFRYIRTENIKSTCFGILGTSIFGLAIWVFIIL